MSYDALGNPLQYYNGNSYMFTWQKGRMLTKTVNNNVTTTYTYNADGIRIGKNVGGTAVEYVLEGATILAEKHGNDVVRYFYDASGSPVGMIYGSTTYLFEKNSLGDVIGMWTSGGTKVASYVYDAWGNIISESISSAHQTASDLNPFRYRGYYYDQETGFYYLQSRYYDPTTGRFLNADSHINANGDLQGFNMYAYCSNNPVMYVDPSGQVVLSSILIGLVVGTIIGGTIGGVASYYTAKESGLEGSDLLWETLKGIGKGAAIGSVGGVLIGGTWGVASMYGAFSTAGTIMISGTGTMLAKTTEVCVLQFRKSIGEGDSGAQIAVDCLDSIINNSLKILSPVGTKPLTMGGSYAWFMWQDITKGTVVSPTFNDFLGKTTKPYFAYLFTLGAWIETVYSCICDDPVAHASDRGYSLK